MKQGEESTEGPRCLQADEDSLCQELGKSRHGKGDRNIVLELKMAELKT